MTRAAIIGCGAIAGGYDETSTDGGIYSHAGAYRACGVEIAAVYDIDQERARAFANYWGAAHVFTSLEDLYKWEEYDIVSFCTPDRLHRRHVTDFLAAGSAKLLWVEKPLAHTFADALAMISAARAKGTGMRVTYQRRWEPVHEQLRREIAAGLIGELTAARGCYVKGLVHIGTTIIDTFRFLLGEPAGSRRISLAEKGSYPNDSSTDITLLYPNGATAVVQGVDGREYSYSLFELDILGTKGRVKITNNGDEYEVFRVVPYGHYAGFNDLKRERGGATKMGQSMRYGLERMLASLAGGWADVSEAESAARNLHLAEEAVDAQKGE